MIESLAPLDENGDIIEFFVSSGDIYEWIADVISHAWADPECGNGVCQPPMEYPSFGDHGCLTDCGEANTTAYLINLEPRFVGDAAEVAELLATVTYNLCTDDLVPLCWWAEEQKFEKNYAEGRVSEVLDLPDAVWVLRYTGTTAGTGLVVGGIRLYSEESEAATSVEGGEVDAASSSDSSTTSSTAPSTSSSTSFPTAPPVLPPLPPPLLLPLLRLLPPPLLLPLLPPLPTPLPPSPLHLPPPQQARNQT
ncbi:hypothetical protein CYMTET_21630 [Cymbomonas tetramitiformis]|uniref:Uncharacterized protein n=1 Tax=Cymbomonas tetramitiformis TaxID=36881 RepID=A0AAE0G1H8_9CHLO|nr:hypothetical protein CYMTET_21630 [Cymbomonas tetramitiformis]